MISNVVDAHVLFRHRPEEVADLDRAVIPMRDSIYAVSGRSERVALRNILRCDYFRRGEAVRMKNMLLRAAKYTRTHLHEYFPNMREQVMQDVHRLEDATQYYWSRLEEAMQEAVPSE